MKKLFRNLKLLSVMLPFLGCQGQNSKAIEIIRELKDVNKITIISLKNGDKAIEEIEDLKKIDEFLGMFIPSNSKSTDNNESLAPKQFEGRIDISYQENKTLSINISLDCCYEFSFNNNHYRERFTYRLGRYLVELFSEVR